MTPDVFIYDTTLRDGSQREGISYSVEDKLKLVQRLDAFGVHYIEGGWPGSNPKDAAFFERVKRLGLKHAKIAAFGSTLRKNAEPENDTNLLTLLAAETPVVTLFGKSWDLQVTDVLVTTLEENLAMIRKSVAFMKAHGRELIYDAEHFFDGYKASPGYALATLRAAAEAGADVLVLCDTNGGTLPWEIEEAVRAARAELSTPIGIHTHEDSGCAVANALSAVRAGAVHIQGTINGYGERVGNANLCSIIPCLQLKMGKAILPAENLARLTELSAYVAEVANLPPEKHLPFVGSSAFAHKGGVHAAAMLRNAASYQMIEPELVGNQRRTVISELSGRGNLLERSQKLGLDCSSEQAGEVLNRIKELEAQGFSFESAEGSVDVMMHRLQPGYRPPFELIDFVVMVEHRQGRGILTDAMVKVRVGDRVIHTAAEGSGPVGALDEALRKALREVYPDLHQVRLDDYKVRILDSESGTDSVVRVLIDTKDGARRWSTVGASPNIIEASWWAMADSLEYALINLNRE
jgi:2-isopropylmalate synthase